MLRSSPISTHAGSFEEDIYSRLTPPFDDAETFFPSSFAPTPPSSPTSMAKKQKHSSSAETIRALAAANARLDQIEQKYQNLESYVFGLQNQVNEIFHAKAQQPLAAQVIRHQPKSISSRGIATASLPTLFLPASTPPNSPIHAGMRFISPSQANPVADEPEIKNQRNPQMSVHKSS